MIDQALLFLKDRLNAHLLLSARAADGGASEDLVQFVDSEKLDQISFKLGGVTVLMVNVEQERTLRPPDLFARPDANGTMQRIQPEIRLNLFVLFVVRFKQYEEGLGWLSKIIRYFQVNPTFDRSNAPDLGDEIERLVLELITLPLAQQNDLWSALRTAYQPSVLYKVGLIIYRDEAQTTVEPVRELELNLRTVP
jgi:hypothetical protein